MKKLFLLLLCGLFSMALSAQNKTVVYGNLGVENVNISVLNTQHGTVSNAQGQYSFMLSGQNKRINLHYSCIGYQDTVVGIMPKMLEKDSLNISFRMRKQAYALNEVSILAERPHFEGDRNIIMDFEVYDGIVCMLQGNGNKFRMLLADVDLSVFDTIPLSKRIKPVRLLKDCMGNCQLMASDSVYQINLEDKNTPFLATERDRYSAVMGDCLFLTDQHLYLRRTIMDGFSTMFYRIDVATKQKQPLFCDDGSDEFKEFIDEMKFDAANRPKHGPSHEHWERFTRIAWFRDSSAHLALMRKKLVYFDHENNQIRQYDLNLNEIKSCPIDYSQKNDWKPQILQDPAKNKFYTFIGQWLHEIDINTGETIPKAKANADIYSKVALWNRHLYILRRQHTSSGKLRSYVERVDF